MTDPPWDEEREECERQTIVGAYTVSRDSPGDRSIRGRRRWDLARKKRPWCQFSRRRSVLIWGGWLEERVSRFPETLAREHSQLSRPLPTAH